MRLLAFLATLVLASCAAAAQPADKPCWTTTFEGDPFTVCRYRPTTDEVRLIVKGREGSLGSMPALQSHLGGDARRVVLAMNAGMYDSAQEPIGLYVAAGRQEMGLNRRDGPGNFHMKPNGVFWVDAKGAPHVTETEAYARLFPKPVWATQSGPMLVVDGKLHPRFSPNGTSLYVRNGVGVRGGEAFFVISDRPVSFGRFARIFRDQLKTPNALFFDGSVSTLWAPSMGRRDYGGGLGPLVVVLRKPSK